jgi:hypothetical protein
VNRFAPGIADRGNNGILGLLIRRHSLVRTMKKIIVHKPGVSRLGGVAGVIHKG